MARTNVRGTQVLDGSVQRVDLDITTVGQAVIAKLIAGQGISLTSTGGDAGTGDVTVKVGGFTPGSVLYADSSGNITQDNAHLFYDATNFRLGLGTNAPVAPLDVLSDGSANTVYFRGRGSDDIGSIQWGPHGGGAATFQTLFSPTYWKMQSGGGTDFLVVDSSGSVVVHGTTPLATGGLTVYGAASQKTAVFRANATTPGHVLELQDSGGSALTFFTALGELNINRVDTSVVSTGAPLGIRGVAGYPVIYMADQAGGGIYSFYEDGRFAMLKGNGYINFPQASGSSNWVFTTRVSGEAANRFEVTVDGKQWWGGGSGSLDTNLFRSAAGVLKTDGSFYVGNGGGGRDIILDGSAGSFRGLNYYSAGVRRWDIYADNSAESGSNAGSDFIIGSYNDAGTQIHTPIVASRATGRVSLADSGAWIDTSGVGTFTGRLFSGGPSTGGMWVDGGTNQFVGSYDADHVGVYAAGWKFLFGDNSAFTIAPNIGATVGIGLVLQNGAGGHTWNVQAGSPGVSNDYFTIIDRTAGDVVRVAINASGQVSIPTTGSVGGLLIGGSPLYENPAFPAIVSVNDIVVGTYASTRSAQLGKQNLFFYDTAGTRLAYFGHDGSNLICNIDTGGLKFQNGHVYPPTDGLAAQTSVGLFAGTGAPSNANGNNGDRYFRDDGTTYTKLAGVWTAPSGSVTFGTPAFTLGTANAAGTSTNVVRADATLAVFDTTAPAALAIGDTGTVGVINFAARRDHGHPMPSFATPTVALGTVAAAGSATTLMRSDATILAFDSTAPTTIAFGDAAAAGSGTIAAYRNHRHGAPANPNGGQVAYFGTPDTITTTGNIIAQAVTNTVLRWNGASAATLFGIAGGTEGRRVVIENVTAAQTLTLAHQSATETTATNRLIVPDSADSPLGPGGIIEAIYDNTTQRWRIIEETTYPSVATTLAFGGAATAGTAGQVPARGDHAHGMPTHGLAAHQELIATNDLTDWPRTADLDLASHKLTSVTDPTAAQDAATKNYVDTRKYSALFGDGSDGAAAFDGTNAVTGATTIGSAPNLAYTLTRDVYYTSATVSSSKVVITGGYRMFCTGTLTNSGTIHNDGSISLLTSAGAGAPGGSVGGGGTGAVGLASGTTSSVGTAAANTAAGYVNLGNAGGTGGGNSTQTGGAGGTVTLFSSTARMAGFRDLQSLTNLAWVSPAALVTTAPAAILVAGGGTGGGSGGRTLNTGSTASGGGGGGAGIVYIAAKTIDNSAGTIRANGGKGGDAGGVGTNKTGGGGGGGGGAVVLIYNTLTAGTEQANGGAPGAGLNTPSIAASAGSNGVVIKIAAV